MRSRLLRALSLARSARDSLLDELVDEYLRSRLYLSEPEIMLPAPPRPTWMTGAMAFSRRISRSSSSSKLKMARSLLLCTLPAPPRPDLKVAGTRESRRVREAGPVADSESVVLVLRSEMTLPAPPREVCMAGRRELGTEGCGSTTRYVEDMLILCVLVFVCICGVGGVGGHVLYAERCRTVKETKTRRCKKQRARVEQCKRFVEMSFSLMSQNRAVVMVAAGEGDGVI